MEKTNSNSHFINRSLYILTIILSLGVASCSQKAEVWIGENGSGRFEALLVMDPILQKYFKDLEELDPALKGGIFEEKAITAALKNQKSLKNVLVEKPKANSIKISASFQDARTLILDKKDPKTHPLLQLKQNGPETTLYIYLDRGNLKKIFDLTSLGHSPALQSLVPQEGTQVTKKEYKELLEYFLEPYDPHPAALIEAASVDIVLHCPRPVLKCSEGIVDGQIVKLTIPLLTIMTLEKPLELSIIY